MKKKMLEKLPPLPATEEILRLVKEDVPEWKQTEYTWKANHRFPVYQRYIYFRADMCPDNILRVSMYMRKDLAAGLQEPRFEIFLDKTKREQGTYKTQEEKWGSGDIESLYSWWTGEDGSEEGMIYRTGFYADKTSVEMVNRYLDAERCEVKTLIKQFQNEIRKEKLTEKHKRETDGIDEDMALVPEIPDDFENWVKEYGFYTERFIFYHAEDRKAEKKAMCMQCGSSITVRNPKRDKECRCENCKKKAVLKPWNGTQKLSLNRTVALIQRLKDDSGWVTRRFKALLIAGKQDDWKPRYYLQEEVREIYDDTMYRYGHYEYGPYKSTGVSRWCTYTNEPNRHGYYYSYYEFGDARIYWKNLKKERKETGIRYIPIEQALKKSPGAFVNVYRMMRSLHLYPEVEYFIKMGFRRLALDILQEEMTLKPGKKPWETLGISKNLMLEALKYDASAREIRLMRATEELGYHMTRTELQFFKQYFDERGIREILQYASPARMYRYYTNVLEEKRDYGDYLDYLEAAAFCGWDMRNDMVLFPKHFRQAHDMAVEEQRARKNKIEDMTIRKKNKEYAKMVPKLKELYGFEDEEFFIKVPEKKSDFTKEGHMNHNCVGGYFDRVVKGETVVVFMRRKERPDESYCTVEITNVASLKQLRSIYNGEAPKEAKDFARKWMMEVKKRLKKEEMKQEKVRIPVKVAAI